MITNDNNNLDDDIIKKVAVDVKSEDEPLPDWIEMIEDESAEDEPAEDEPTGDESAEASGSNQKKKMSRFKKSLLILGGIILAFAVILVVAFIIMRITGKNSIYGGANSSKPDFSRVESGEDVSDAELNINPEDMNEINIQSGTTSGDNIPEDESDTNPGDMNEMGNQSGTTSAGSNESRNPTSNISQAPAGEGYDVIYNGEKYSYNDDMITLLVLGIDNTEPVKPAADGLSGGQSDAIFLVLMNPHTMVMDIIAIPRDSITKLWMYDRNGNFVQTGRAQICLQHGYGDGMELSNERALKAVSYLMYDIPIHSVTSINMGAVGMLNDAVGGITLQSIQTFDCAGSSFVKGQTVTLMGNMAYDYVHYRDISRHNTASERLARQKQYVTLFIDKALSAVKNDLGVVTDVYNIIDDYVVTDLSVDEMVYLASEAISYDFGEFYSLQGTLDTSMKYERYYLDEEALQALIIDKFYEKVK